jgi:hypothetical protein
MCDVEGPSAGLEALASGLDLGLARVFVTPPDTAQASRVDFAFPAAYGVLGRTTLRSCPAKVTYRGAPHGRDDETTIAVSLQPEGDRHRLCLHLGGRSASYRLSLTSLGARADFHVPAEAYRRTVVETDVYLSRVQVLSLGADLRLPCLVRLQPSDCEP